MNRFFFAVLFLGIAGCATIEWRIVEADLVQDVLSQPDALLIKWQRQKYGDGVFTGESIDENIARVSGKSLGLYARRYVSASGKNSDGTKVFFLYPGLPTITEVVVREGKADVLFPGGEPKYRRFSRSDNVAGALRYEDVALAQTIDVSESVQRILMECWADDDVPLEDKASIYLLLPDKCFSGPKDQT